MYIDAILDKKTDTVHIAERIGGQRVLRHMPAPYVFYYEDVSGSHRSIYGHSCKRSATSNSHKFYTTLQERRDAGRRIFESDINPVFRALADRYMAADAPVLHLGFFDIEVAFDRQRGFAPPENPFNPVTAISLYRSADAKLVSFVLKPDGLSLDAAETIVSAIDDCELFDDERALLLAFLDAIEDVDCLTGWNSSAYDVPYLVNRIRRVIDIQTTKRFCLWQQAPTPRQYKNKFGKMVDSYDFVGRVHLDYLDLYAKHNPQQRLSYALNSIGEIEVGETKIPYDGTLDKLYNQDFEKFIHYNRQDVMLMVKIDRKLKFIELANQIAHTNCVLLKTTMGSVALVEQAIINEMHAMGCVVPDRPSKDEPSDDDEIDGLDDDDVPTIAVVEGRTPVVGAYVAQPKVGLHDHIGCVDIKSLYPSAIRALNMSPETLVGQIRPDETMKLVEDRVAKLSKTQRAEAWEGLFCTCEVQHMLDQDSTILTVDFFDHLNDTKTTRQMAGKELYQYVFDDANQVCISANGTIYGTTIEGMIPALLAKWYSDREAMQQKQKMYATSGDLELAAFWDRNQQAGKIRLNATYGAILNAGCRFNDDRLGQSTTLSGRSIVRHMNAKINEMVTGSYDYRGDAIVYADTDSCYFSAYQALKDRSEFKNADWSRESIIALYDAIATEANETFPEFMDQTFHTGLQRGGIISAGRELVASKGLFIKKKKYAVLMYDKEGTRLDGDGKLGKLKVMGLDLKRADTPKVMQQFLERLLMNLLTGISQAQMFDDILAFRLSFKSRPAWEKGSPKKVGNLAQYASKLNDANDLSISRRARRNETFRVNVPGHVRASLNWNHLCEVHGDRYATRITDSNRIIVCKLRQNALGMTSIAYPMDEQHLPDWFRELPFDDEAMEATIIDQKIMNLCGVLDWDLTDTKIRAGANLFQWT